MSVSRGSVAAAAAAALLAVLTVTGCGGRTGSATSPSAGTGATLSPGAGAPAASAPDGSARAGTSAPGGPSGSAAMPSSADPEASTLRDFAIRNGPEQLPLPADLMISYTVDNPNNVTLVIDVSQGSQTYRFLRDRLPGAGFTITADGQQSLTFSGHGWSGAYTVSQDLAGLTLRRP